MTSISVGDIMDLLRYVRRAAVSTERKRKATTALQNARRELLSLNPNEDVIEAGIDAAKTAGITGVDIIWTRRNLRKVSAWNRRKKKGGRCKKAVGKRKKNIEPRDKKAVHPKKAVARRRRVVHHLQRRSRK